MVQENLKAREVMMGGIKVSQVAFGTEHLNQYTPKFGGTILRDAALQNNVFFWDTDNCYGSQPAVAEGLKMLDRSKVIVTSKTYAKTEQEAEESLARILKDLDTPYIDFCLLHGVVYGELMDHLPALAALRRLKDKGFIRQIGLSTHSANVAWNASDIEGIEVLCVTFNRDGSRIEEGDFGGMVQALKKAHNVKKKGTYVIKTLGRGDLVHDLENALNWVMDYHEYIDVYNIGYRNLRELRQDLSLVNNYFDRLGVRNNE